MSRLWSWMEVDLDLRTRSWARRRDRPRSGLAVYATDARQADPL